MLKKLILVGIFFYAFHAQAQVQHQVNLIWSEPTTTIKVGFNIYRCTLITCPAPSVSSSSWTKIIGSIPSTQLTYSDLAVVAGATYSYFETAYDTAGVAGESAPSNVQVYAVPSSGGTTGPPPSPVQSKGTVQ